MIDPVIVGGVRFYGRQALTSAYMYLELQNGSQNEPCVNRCNCLLERIEEAQFEIADLIRQLIHGDPGFEYDILKELKPHLDWKKDSPDGEMPERWFTRAVLQYRSHATEATATRRSRLTDMNGMPRLFSALDMMQRLKPRAGTLADIQAEFRRLVGFGIRAVFSYNLANRSKPYDPDVPIRRIVRLPVFPHCLMRSDHKDYYKMLRSNAGCCQQYYCCKR